MLEETDNAHNIIRRQIERLDQVATDYETRWGIGRLQSLAPPDVREKWERQTDKLAEAIANADALNIITLVDGTIRGWGLLERLANEAGHAPYDPVYLEYKIGGQVYAVARSAQDAQSLHKPRGRDAVIVTVGELLRSFIERHSNAFKLDDIQFEDDLQALPVEFWKKGGDSLDL